MQKNYENESQDKNEDEVPLCIYPSCVTSQRGHQIAVTLGIISYTTGALSLVAGSMGIATFICNIFEDNSYCSSIGLSYGNDPFTKMAEIGGVTSLVTAVGAGLTLFFTRKSIDSEKTPLVAHSTLKS